MNETNQMNQTDQMDRIDPNEQDRLADFFSSLLPPESSHELRFCQDMSLARIQHLSLGRAGLQIQRDIQRIEREVVPMGLARRRAGSAISDPFEVVQSLQSPVGQTVLR